MRVLICGSRHMTDYHFLNDVLQKLNITHIIQGGAAGADTLAEVYAIKNNITFTRFDADWKTYGRAAGPIRNKKMLVEGEPDLVVAFLAQDSRGTRNMIDQARKANKRTQIVEI